MYSDKELHDIYEFGKTYKIQQKYGEWIELLRLINSFGKKLNILEIGSYDGGTSVCLCKFAKKMLTIDLYENPKHIDFCSNNTKYEYLNLNSQLDSTFDTVKNYFGDEKIDVIFIDGDHRYEGVKRDYELYNKLGCNIIVFHDIADVYVDDFGVNKLWKDLCINNKSKCIFTDYAGQYFDINDLELRKIPELSWGGLGVIYK
jgi:predicted O-methyltransferase YrrM